jgi:hypothetical protein
MPLLLCLSICERGLNISCIVFRVRNVTFIFVSRKRVVTFLTSLPLSVNVSHFVLLFCESTSVFCFSGGGGNLLITFMSYSLFLNMFLIVFISVSFASFVIGYVCNRLSKQLMPDSLCSYG